MYPKMDFHLYHSSCNPFLLLSILVEMENRHRLYENPQLYYSKPPITIGSNPNNTKYNTMKFKMQTFAIRKWVKLQPNAMETNRMKKKLYSQVLNGSIHIKVTKKKIVKCLHFIFFHSRCTILDIIWSKKEKKTKIAKCFFLQQLDLKRQIQY